MIYFSWVSCEKVVTYTWNGVIGQLLHSETLILKFCFLFALCLTEHLFKSYSRFTPKLSHRLSKKNLGNLILQFITIYNIPREAIGSGTSTGNGSLVWGSQAPANKPCRWLVIYLKRNIQVMICEIYWITTFTTCCFLLSSKFSYFGFWPMILW